MKGVSARYPAYAASLGRVVDLEQRINACVTENQRATPLAMESEEMLALSALVARQSRDMPITVEVDARSAETYERGRQIYFRRQGQLNLACTQCHDASWGKTLLAERISQGHPADWPAYRLEWQSIGSSVGGAYYFGVRAEMPHTARATWSPSSSPARRASGLVSDAPGVRR
jgi:sulfur-oxidizing protein SoxA